MRRRLAATVLAFAAAAFPAYAGAAAPTSPGQPDVSCSNLNTVDASGMRVTAVARIVAPGATSTGVRCDVLLVATGQVVGAASRSCQGPVCAAATTVAGLPVEFYAVCWTGWAQYLGGYVATPYTCSG